MKPVAIVEGDFTVVKEFDDASDARQALRHLEPGTYHVVRFIESGVEVQPPPAATTNVVKRGKTFIKRERKDG